MKQELNKNLEEKLKALKPDLSPDKDFQKVLLNKLSKRHKELHQKTSIFSNFFQFKTQFASGLIALFITSTSFYAYASEGVVEGDILYPVKKSIEKVEETFAKTEEDRTLFYQKMAERRLNELDYLESQNKFSEKTAMEAKTLLSRAREEILSIAPTEINDSYSMMEIESTSTENTRLTPPSFQENKIDKKILDLERKLNKTENRLNRILEKKNIQTEKKTNRLEKEDLENSQNKQIDTINSEPAYKNTINTTTETQENINIHDLNINTILENNDFNRLPSTTSEPTESFQRN